MTLSSSVFPHPAAWSFLHLDAEGSRPGDQVIRGKAREIMKDPAKRGSAIASFLKQAKNDRQELDHARDPVDTPHG